MRQPTSWHQSAYDQLEVPLLIVSVDRQVAYANPAARRLFGAAPGALEGAGIERLVVSERRGELRNIEDVLKGGSARRVRSVLRREDGGRLDVTMSVEPCFDAAGRVEAATVRYELIAASGRMSAAPDGRADARQAFGRSSPSTAPFGQRITEESGSHVNPVSRTPRPPPLSGPFQTSGPVAGDLEALLLKVASNLSWLEDRLALPATEASLDDSRERARVLLVIGEARSQLRQALDEAKGAEASVPPLPAPPKLPTI